MENFYVDIDLRGNKRYIYEKHIVQFIQKKKYCIVVTVAGSYKSRSTAEHIIETLDRGKY